MKANELSAKDLMIGDWVMCQSIKEKYARVTEIYFTLNESPKRMVSLNANGARYCLPIESIKPIPLTPEILEKSDFYYGYTSREEDAASNTITSLSETDKGWCWDEGSGAIKIMFPDEADGGLVEIDDQSFNRYLSFVFCDNLYVHELQRVLKLCGITREIII